jgi:hypothetical protein
MDQNYDELIAEMLIELHELQLRNEEQREINIKFNRRMDLTIKRMVMAEKRLEQLDKKIDQSMKEFKEFARIQNEINKLLLKEIRKNGNKNK